MGVALPVYRMSDREYQFHSSSGQVFHFEVKGKRLTPGQRMESAKKTARAVEKFLKNQDPVPSKKFEGFTFNDGRKRWHVKRPPAFKWYHKVLLWFIPTLGWYRPVKSGSIKLDIYAKPRLCKTKKGASPSISSKMVKAFGLDPVHDDLKKIGVKAHAQNIEQGVSGYRDPFTKLATFAFQCLEDKIIERDEKKKPNDEEKRLVYIENNGWIQLVTQNSPLATVENKRRAFDAFLMHIDKFYGRDKCEYINHLHTLNLERIHELIPEDVYRFNIGTTNIEFQDVKQASQELLSLQNQISPENLEEPFSRLEPYLVPACLYYGMQRVLKQQFQKEDPTIGDFSKWLDELGLTSSPLSLSNPEVFHKLVSVLRPTEEELERSYTGKKICQVIQSAYTTAGTKNYKPWIDQQELTQISQELIKCTSFESYMECLAHVVVKKHLCRRHPKERFRVGALIPAPPADEKGPIRWYTVTRCTTNQYIYSYTLESACNDVTLPAVECFRSTASSEYALYSSGSVSNDFGQLNSPGFMGIRLLDQYKNDFYKDRTIPLWVGYQYNAQTNLLEGGDLQKILHNLSMSNQRLIESESQAHRLKTFREILKANDAVLNDLFLRYAHILDYDLRDHFPGFVKHYKRIVKKYIQIDYKQADQLPLKRVKADATILYDQLRKIQHVKLKKFVKPRKINGEVERLKDLINDLKKDLRQHILTDTPNGRGQKELEVFYRSTFQPLEHLRGEAELLLRNGRLQEALQKMQEWSDALNNLAFSQSENIESKIHQHICWTGHSLGGAESMAAFVHSVSNQNRIPLPGFQCTVGIFDSPATHSEDNDKFKKLGNDNHGLFLDLGVRFNLFIREESGDFFRLGGETKLGSTRSEKEAIEVEKWLNFDAAVNERLLTCRQREIAESSVRHGTRFLEGKPSRVYKVIDRGSIVTKTGLQIKNPDYQQINYSTFIQGLLDAHGKNTDLPPDVAKKNAKELYSKVWKLPSGVWKNLLREEKRKSVHWFFLFARKILYLMLSCGRQGRHVAPSNVLDSRGCLAVTLNNGIVSLPKHF